MSQLILLVTLGRVLGVVLSLVMLVTLGRLSRRPTLCADEKSDALREPRELPRRG